MNDVRLIAVETTEPTVEINTAVLGRMGMDALRVLSMSHEDGYVRIAAAEAMIRLAIEFPLKGDAAQAFGTHLLTGKGGITNVAEVT